MSLDKLPNKVLRFIFLDVDIVPLGIVIDDIFKLSIEALVTSKFANFKLFPTKVVPSKSYPRQFLLIFHL